jgi:hypothetical protein
MSDTLIAITILLMGVATGCLIGHLLLSRYLKGGSK